MKKNSLFLLLILSLTSCNNGNNGSSSFNSSNTSSTTTSLSSSSNEEAKIVLEDVYSELLGKVGQNEVLKSSKVEFYEVDKRGDSRSTVYSETMDIYNDYTSVANGYNETTYLTNGVESKKRDEYQRVATAIMYNDTTPIFYLVTDYKDGTLNTSWSDSAHRLPIKEIGDPSNDGVDYLLASSLPGQTTKQVSLIIANYLSTYFISNPDLQTAMPYAKKVVDGATTIYKIDNYSYNYDSEGSNVKVELAFETKIVDGYLKEASTLYKTTTTRGSEVYVEENTTKYDITYDERVSSLTNENMLNVEEYFVYEVNDVQAYFYNDQGNKEVASLNNLPLNKYVRFEAIDYFPLKAVDLEMYAISSSNTDVISISSNVFYTNKTGEATLTLESATGVTFEVDVRINIPEITKIKYDDSSSSVERGENNRRYIYTSTTYTGGIYVTLNPSSAYLEDVEISVSNSDVLTVNSSITGKVINLTLVVGDVDVTEVESVSITFKSKTNPEVSTTITYYLKQRLSHDELITKLMNNTYRWNNLYGSGYGIMSFTSENTGKVEYYDGDDFLGETTFTFTVNGTSFNITANSGSLFGYNSGDITLDGETIIARVDDVIYVHTYKRVVN